MDREKAIERLKEIQENPDHEVGHIQADRVLCKLLIRLGYADVVEEWYDVTRWYA